MKIKNLLTAIAISAISMAGSSYAQTGGRIHSGNVLGNPGVSEAPATDATQTSMLDRAFGSTGGFILFRGVTAWTAALMTGDCTFTNAGVIVCTQTNGVAFAPIATSGSASNLSTGTVPAATLSSVGALRPGGRLTLATATPVMTSTVTAAGTVYYTPYVGNLIPIWNGSVFLPTQFTELSNILANSSVGNAGPAAAVGSHAVYDLFVWSSSGTLFLTRGPAWTNATTRGYTLTRTSGILTNTSAITNGPAGGAGTFVGTIATDAAGGTVTFSTGGSASGGTAGILDVWNMNNRVIETAGSVDSGAQYTYSSATIRQARASAGNQIQFVTGLQEDTGIISLFGRILTNVTVTSTGSFGIGIDSTTTFSYPPAVVTPANQGGTGGANNISGCLTAPQSNIGYHTITSNEGGNTADTFTYNVGGSANALYFTIMM